MVNAAEMNVAYGWRNQVVPVEEGTKLVISVNFCAFVERKFNNLQTEFFGEKGLEGVFQ